MSELDYKMPSTLRLRALLVSGVAISLGTVAMVAGVFVNPHQLFLSFWVSTLFVVSIGLGCLFWLFIHYVSNARWSTAFRRLYENTALVLLPAAFLLVPGMIGCTFYFPWVQSEEALLSEKQAYLNVPFFLIRGAIYIAAWCLLSWVLRRASLRQDSSGNGRHTLRMEGFSAAGLILLALTSTFASFDWIMSLDYHWYSNLFGVYFWSGAFVSSLAVTILLSLGLRRGQRGQEIINIDRLNDLGTLLFAFSIFWAYIAFSQYFLIWYANIPEETAWYIERIEGDWGIVGVILCLGQFVVPFFLLLTRQWRRSPFVLGIAAGVVLVSHWLDLYWQLMPSLHTESVAFHWLDVSTLLFVLGVTSGFWSWFCGKESLVPVNDTGVVETLSYTHT